MAKCPICGKFFTISFIKGNDGTQVCSDEHKIQYNKIILLRGNSSNNNNNQPTPSKSLLSTILKTNDEKPKSEHQIAEDEKLRQKNDESDARLFDSIKKLFLGKKNKLAKELHLKLEEIESEIRFSIAKNDIDEAGRLIRQLKHESSLFVPKTNITYKKYWLSKREECMNRL